MPDVAVRIEEEVLLALGVSRRQCDNIITRAEALGVGLEDVAIQWGIIDEHEFYRALAHHLGLDFVAQPFAIARASLSPHSAEAGLSRAEDGIVVAAPRGQALRQFLLTRPEACRLTSPAILRQSLQHAFATDHAMIAAGTLSIMAPHETAYRDGASSGFVVASFFLALVALVFCEPYFALPITIPISLLFLWTIGQRIFAIITRDAISKRSVPPSLSPAELPFYSVLIPLYREDAVIPRLIGALEALDYPPEKLEVLLLVENDDQMTRAALSTIRLLPFIRIVPCPNGMPRTKPRALNVGLRECCGEFVAVYDAEDRPAPDQLLKAAALFRASGHDVACLQAELAIDNAAENFWTRGFALEYAALFQIVVPSLCRHQLPVALGGTSNHFRRSVLLDLNGWDAWNVTEDADLGLRLALHGYSIAHLPSQTWEEAPDNCTIWRKQRMRWIKGWMQTSLVHLPDIIRHARALNLSQKIAMLHHLIGTPISALLTPLFSIALGVGWLEGNINPIHHGFVAFGSVLAFAAFAMMVALYRAALPELNARDRIRALVAMPVYLLSVCCCAWLALIELVHAPFQWNKTPHGQPSKNTSMQAQPEPNLRRSLPRRLKDKFRHKPVPASVDPQAARRG